MQLTHGGACVSHGNPDETCDLVELRMSSEDRKDASKIKVELLKEFERGKRNREEVLDQLGKRSRQEGESAQNYAYELKELVKLAYPSFENKI